MAKFSEHFGINKKQAELDFVDIDLKKDLPLYIDPYALAAKEDEWSEHCRDLVYSFFEEVLLAVKQGKTSRGVELLSELGEPWETHLGVSTEGFRGRGIGPIQARVLFNAIKNSKAAKTGILEDIADFALFIPGIGRDKVSDMTTNIIRKPLIDYTQSQCLVHNVPLLEMPAGVTWNPKHKQWDEGYSRLPVFCGEPIILVPKYCVRYQVLVSAREYRRNFVYEFLRVKHRKPGDSLATVIKNKRGQDRIEVFKKTLDANLPKGKDFLAEFSAQNPDVVRKYREMMAEKARDIQDINGENFDESELAVALIDKLASIKAGKDSADEYHDFMLGTLSFLFFPYLILPRKENKINDGRKRIDITYINSKCGGFFRARSLDANIVANVVLVECKNYKTDIANEELDQLVGRFSRERGKLGILAYRSAEDEELVLKRCRDISNAGLGLVLPINDKFIVDLLNLVADGSRGVIDQRISELYRQIVS